MGGGGLERDLELKNNTALDFTKEVRESSDWNWGGSLSQEKANASKVVLIPETEKFNLYPLHFHPEHNNRFVHSSGMHPYVEEWILNQIAIWIFPLRYQNILGQVHNPVQVNQFSCEQLQSVKVSPKDSLPSEVLHCRQELLVQSRVTAMHADHFLACTGRRVGKWRVLPVSRDIR